MMRSFHAEQLWSILCAVRRNASAGFAAFFSAVLSTGSDAQTLGRDHGNRRNVPAMRHGFAVAKATKARRSASPIMTDTSGTPTLQTFFGRTGAMASDWPRSSANLYRGRATGGSDQRCSRAGGIYFRQLHQAHALAVAFRGGPAENCVRCGIWVVVLPFFFCGGFTTDRCVNWNRAPDRP